jgi:hypothetical protein
MLPLYEKLWSFLIERQMGHFTKLNKCIESKKKKKHKGTRKDERDETKEMKKEKKRGNKWIMCDEEIGF